MQPFSDVANPCVPVVGLTLSQRRSLGEALEAKDLESARTLLVDAGLAGDPTQELVPILLERRAALVAQLTKDTSTTVHCRPAGGCGCRATTRLLPDGLTQAWVAGDVDRLRAEARDRFIDMTDLVGILLDWEAGDLADSIFAGTGFLLSLRFDHAARPDASSALHISDVCRPEWRPGVSDPAASPVLYATSLHGAAAPIVKVELRAGRLATFGGMTEIKADGGGMLGSIDPFSVNLSGPGVVTVDVPLAHHTFRGAQAPVGARGMGVENVTWRWSHRVGAGPWRPLAETRHRVYLVPGVPQDPWDVSAPGRANNPWQAALDLACRAFPQAADDPWDGIAIGVCELLNPGGAAPNPLNIRYALDGNQRYGGGGFRLRSLLQRGVGGFGNGDLVNCDDCAGLVVSLANLLGCDLTEQRILTSNNLPLRPLGYGQWWVSDTEFVASWGPAQHGALSYHNVAWRGNGVDSGRVFDVTYHLNGFPSDENAERPHALVRVARAPYGIPFSRPGTLDYIEMLHATLDGWSLGPQSRRHVI